MSRVAHLDLAILTSDARRDLLSLPLQDDPLGRLLRKLVESSSEPAQESLQFLLRHLLLGDDSPLNGLLESQQDELCYVWLGEDTSRGFTLLGGGLGLERVRGTIASAKRTCVSIPKKTGSNK